MYMPKLLRLGPLRRALVREMAVPYLARVRLDSPDRLFRLPRLRHNTPKAVLKPHGDVDYFTTPTPNPFFYFRFRISV